MVESSVWVFVRGECSASLSVCDFKDGKCDLQGLVCGSSEDGQGSRLIDSGNDEVKSSDELTVKLCMRSKRRHLAGSGAQPNRRS